MEMILKRLRVHQLTPSVFWRSDSMYLLHPKWYMQAIWLQLMKRIKMKRKKYVEFKLWNNNYINSNDLFLSESDINPYLPNHNFELAKINYFNIFMNS